jgi:hypothetical protein
LQPGIKTAGQGRNVLIPIVDQNLRRTGARFFVWSGAVKDNPLIRINFPKSGLSLPKRDIQGARYVAGFIDIGIAHIYKQCLFLV